MFSMRALCGSVGLEGDLPAGVALGVNADVFQGHGPAGRWSLVRR